MELRGQAAGALRAGEARSGQRAILDVEAAKKKLPKNQEDYAEIFALYTALDTLKALTDRLGAKNLPSVERSQIERRYEAGLKDVNAFVATMDFDKANVVRGVVTEG
jgi:hypothetical protein